MRLTRLLGVAVLLCLGAGAAKADPILQIYLQGGTYDATTESWVVSGSGTFTLWAIGNLSGPGGKGKIDGVKLAVAYAADSGTTLSITGTTTGGFGGFTDPSTPSNASYLSTYTNGEIPKLGDGSNLPTHGIYGSGTDWQEYALGNFTTADSPCGDFSFALPSPGVTGCQINAYTITITGGTSTWLHFDLYDHYYAKKGAVYKFAPFSHDGEVTTKVPEPASLSLLLSGLLGVGVLRRRRRG